MTKAIATQRTIATPIDCQETRKLWSFNCQETRKRSSNWQETDEGEERETNASSIDLQFSSNLQNTQKNLLIAKETKNLWRRERKTAKQILQENQFFSIQKSIEKSFLNAKIGRREKSVRRASLDDFLNSPREVFSRWLCSSVERSLLSTNYKIDWEKTSLDALTRASREIFLLTKQKQSVKRSYELITKKSIWAQ